MAELGYELIKTLSVLNAGRVAPPQFDNWRLIGDRLTTVRDPEPSAVTDGIDVSEAIKGFVGTRTSDNAATWQLWLKVHTADAGETYGVDFFAGDLAAAFTVSAAGSATLATVISNLLSAFAGSAAFIAAGGAADQPAGTLDIVRLTFTNLDEHLLRNGAVQIGVNGLADTGFQSLVPEATSCAWQLWALTKGTDEWTKLDVRGSSDGPQDLVKICAGLAGVERHYIQVIDANGIVLPVYAPAVNELDQATAEQAAAQSLAALQAQLLTILPNDYLGRLPAVSHDGRAFDSPILVRGAASAKFDGAVIVQTSSTALMSANPLRRGFMVRAKPTNLLPVNIRWNVTGDDVATPDDMELQPGEIYIQSGDDIPGNGMLAISETEPVADVWNVDLTAIGAASDTHVVTVLGQVFTHVSDGVETLADQVDDFDTQITASGLPVTITDNGDDFDITADDAGQPLRVSYAQTGACAGSATNSTPAVGDRVNVQEW